ncbi:MAG TPA: iron-sulfur cluster assembly protein [Actinoplanes sp.]|nr:iron-sulfur cluster assembly protein [Actinoplanes sp.]
MITRDAAWSALGQVRDPELDRPITELGFVARIEIKPDATVRAELRLPTYFCAPNFAWLMVADARDALAGVAEHVEVVLIEHFVSAEINAGVAAVSDFAASFDAGGLDPDLAELRETFERKAHVAAQERLARALTAGGADPASLAGMTVAEAAARAPDETAGVLRRRTRLGLRSDFALCDDGGAALPGERLPAWLRFARTVRVSIDGNAGFCRGLLETRYGLTRTA